MTNTQVKCDHMEPRENEEKNNKDRSQNQHVENSLKTGIAKRKSSKMRRDERRQKKARNLPKSLLQQKQG